MFKTLTLAILSFCIALGGSAIYGKQDNEASPSPSPASQKNSPRHEVRYNKSYDRTHPPKPANKAGWHYPQQRAEVSKVTPTPVRKDAELKEAAKNRETLATRTAETPRPSPTPTATPGKSKDRLNVAGGNIRNVALKKAGSEASPSPSPTGAAGRPVKHHYMEVPTAPKS